MSDWRPQILTCGKIVYFETKRDECMPAHRKEKKSTHEICNSAMPMLETQDNDAESKKKKHTQLRTAQCSSTRLQNIFEEQ